MNTSIFQENRPYYAFWALFLSLNLLISPIFNIPFSAQAQAANVPVGLKLLTADDSGTSSTDSITNDNTPRFEVCAPTGHVLELYRRTPGTAGAGIQISPENVQFTGQNTTCTGISGSAVKKTITSAVIPDGEHEIFALSDLRGRYSLANISNTITVTIDTEIARPVLSITDTGSDTEDGVTKERRVDITGLEPLGTWEYEISDNLNTWVRGAGTNFNLQESTAKKSYKVRQTDQAGNQSEEGSLALVIYDQTKPSLTPGGIPNQEVVVDTNFRYEMPDGTFTDDHAITYAATGHGDGIAFNRETQTWTGTPRTVATQEVTVTATDLAGNEKETTFNIDVISAAAAANNPPTDITIGGSSEVLIDVVENTTLVGQLAAVDTDTGDSHTYSFASEGSQNEDNDKFEIDSSNRLSFKAANTPDFENPTDTGGVSADNIYSVKIKTNDGTVDFEKVFGIRVTNANEVVTFTIEAIPDATVREGVEYRSPNPVINGTPNGDVRYSISGADKSAFGINTSIGFVRMVARDYDNPIDADTNNDYEITIIATDADTNTASTSWTVSVTEAPAVNNAPTIDAFTLATDIAVSRVHTITITDPNDIDTLTAEWKYVDAKAECTATAFNTAGTALTLSSDANSAGKTADITYSGVSNNGKFICVEVSDETVETYGVSEEAISNLINTETATIDPATHSAVIPSGLIFGDKFRLLFVTFVESNGVRSINGANSHVQSRANTITLLQSVSSKFKALVSAVGTDARDNTGTNTATGSDIDSPIYWHKGLKVADSYVDFYDGNWDSREGRDERGQTITRSIIVTGTTSTGEASPGKGIDVSLSTIGRTGGTTSEGQEIDRGSVSGVANFALYGLSPVFTIDSQTNAEVVDLEVSLGTLSPAFDKDEPAYTLSIVGVANDSITITPTVAPSASFVIAGTAADNSTPLTVTGAVVSGLTLGVNTVTITTTSGDTNTTETYTLTITISDPRDIVLSGATDNAKSIVENTTEVGTFTTTGSAVGVTHRYFLVTGEEDNDKFTLNTNTGVIAFKTAPDFETPRDVGDTAGDNTYVIKVQTLGAGSIYEETFIITVTDVVERVSINLAETANVDATTHASFIPTGLTTAGDKFRVLFLTTIGYTEGGSTKTIAQANTFAKNRVNASTITALRSFSSQFRALVSTADTDARDNTGTNTETGADIDAPIYWLQGEKVADGYADFYDNSWGSRAGKTEHGDDLTSGIIYTGSTFDGTVKTDNGIDSTNTATGSVINGVGNEIDNDSSPSSEAHRIYALSPVFTVTATPTIAIDTIEGDDIVNAAERTSVQISGTSTGIPNNGEIDLTFDVSDINVGIATVRNNAWEYTIPQNQSALLPQRQVTVTAEYTGATAVEKTFDVDTVLPRLVTDIPDRTATIGTDFEFQIPSGTFTDANALTYTSSALTNGLTFATDTWSGVGSSLIAGPVTVTVTATDVAGNERTDEFIITIAAASTDATLSSLGVSDGVLYPQFDSSITEYRINTANDSITITTDTTDSPANFVINGTNSSDSALTISSGEVSGLELGYNTVEIVVTAEDGTTTKTYNLGIERTQPIFYINPISKNRTGIDVTAGAQFGQSSTNIGDLDGDGFDEIAVGAHYGQTQNEPGEVHILFMNSDATVRNIVKIDKNSPGLAIGTRNGFGYSIANLGDLDIKLSSAESKTNSKTTIAVGGLYDGTGGSNRGAVHLINLNSSGAIVGTPVKIAHGSGGLNLANTSWFGTGVVNLGDLNIGLSTSQAATSVATMAIGASGANTVYIVNINSNGAIVGDVVLINNTTFSLGLDVQGGSQDWFGISVESLGDLDGTGDGIVTLAVAAYGDNVGNERDSGSVRLINIDQDGDKVGNQVVIDRDTVPAIATALVNADDFFGAGVANLGDVDGDGPGKVTLAIGAPTHSQYQGKNQAGIVILLNLDETGSMVGELNSINVVTSGIFVNANERLGCSVSNIGDINNDGRDDIAFGQCRAEGVTGLLYISSTFPTNHSVKTGEAVSINLQKVLKSVPNIVYAIDTPKVLPTGLTLDGENARITGTSTEVKKESYALYASNSAGTRVFSQFRIESKIVNADPTDIILSGATNGAKSIVEDTTAVGTFTTTDADASDSHRYTLVPGTGAEDNDKFKLIESTGVITFKTAPDFETPRDVGDTAGDNTYAIRVQTSDGTATYVKTFIITVTATPTITIGIVSEDGFVNATEDDSSVEFSGTTTNIPEGVGKIRINVVGAANPRSGNVKADGTWVVDFPTGAITGLSEGTKTVEAFHSESNTKLDTRTFVYDRTAPAVANAISNQDATEGTQFTFQFASNVFSDANTPITYTSDVSSITWLSFVPATRTFTGTPASAGSETITVTATDAAGNTQTDEFTITIAAASTPTPTILISAISGGYVNDTEDESDVTISGTSTNIANGQTIALAISDTDGTDVTKSPSVTSDSWETTLTSADIKGLVEGTITITAAYTGATNATQTFIYDRTAPAAPTLSEVVTGPSNVEGITNIQTVTAAGLEANSTWEYRVGFGSWIAGTGSTFNATEGNNDYFIRQTDQAGNQSAEGAIYSLTYDATSPVLAIEVPNQTATIGTDFSFTIPSGTFTDTNSLSYTSSALTNGLTFATDTWSGVGSSITEGVVTVTVTATDIAGNTETDEFTITISAAPGGGGGGGTPSTPTIAINAISTDDYVNENESTSIEISGTSTNIDDGGIVNLTFTGVLTIAAKTATVTNNSWRYTILSTETTISDGEVTVTAASTGATSVDKTFTIDTAPPTLQTANEIQDQTATVGTQFNLPFPAGTYFEDDNTITYSFSDESNGITFNTTTNAWEGTPTTTTSVTVTVTATDVAGNTETDEFTITIVAAPVSNSAPTDITLDNLSVPENTTAVGTFTTTDSDNTSHTYELVAGTGAEDNDKFTLDTNTGVIAFKAANTPDFENPTDLGDTANNNTYAIRVQTTDGTSTLPKEFIITVTDVDETDADLSGLTVAGATLAETFAVDTVAYTSTVENSVTSVTITPTVSHSEATVAYTLNGAVATNTITLADGTNTIAVIVTAEDRSTTKTYTITITRAAAPGGGGGGGGTPSNSAPTIEAFTLATNAAPSRDQTITVTDANNGDTLTVEWFVSDTCNDANRTIASGAGGLTDVTSTLSGTSADNSGGRTATITYSGAHNDTYRICAAVYDGTDRIYGTSTNVITGLTVAGPTITVNAISGGYVNDAEDESDIAISGASARITSSDTITLVITDSGSGSVTKTPTVTTNAWGTTLTSAEMKGLAEGIITVTATYTGATPATTTFVYDATAPATPTLALANDTGSSNSDGITSDATVNVTGLETNATWEWTEDGTDDVVDGSGTSFELRSNEGAYNYMVTQTDLAGNSTPSIAYRYDHDANAPILANAITEKDATVGTQFTYAIPINTFTEFGSPPLTYTSSGEGAGITFATNTWSGNPNNAETLSITLTATDVAGNTQTDEFTITIAAATTPPTITSFSLTAGNAYTKTEALRFSDPDNTDTLTAVWFPSGENNCTEASYNSVTGAGNGIPITLSGSSSANSAGRTGDITYFIPSADSASDWNNRRYVCAAVTDGTTVVTKRSNGQFSGLQKNRRPTIAFDPAPVDTSAKQDFELRINVTDLDSTQGITAKYKKIDSSATCEATTTDSGATDITEAIGATNGKTVALTFNSEDDNDKKICVTAEDNSGIPSSVIGSAANFATPTDSPAITGIDATVPVVAADIPDQTAETGTRLTYQIPSGTFTDSNSLTYTSSGHGTELTFTTDTWTGTPTTATKLTVTVTATDPAGNTATDEFTITISAPPVVNTAPTDITLSNNTVAENITTVGTFTTTDAVGDRHTYLLEPTGTGNEDNAKFTLTEGGELSFKTANTPNHESPTDAGDTANNNTYAIKVKTTDQDGEEYIKEFIITVTDVDENDANLTDLVVTGATVTPAFAVDTVTYEGTVDNTVTSVTVTPTRSHPDATIKIGGTAATSGSATTVTLSNGANAIAVEVTAEDTSETKTYTINITKTSAPTPGGGGGGGGTPLPTPTPTIAINTISTDGYVNNSEDESPVIISGTTTNINDSETIDLTFSDSNITATTATVVAGTGGADDTWETRIPSAQIKAAAEGAIIVTATYSSTTATQIFTYDRTAPTVSTARTGNERISTNRIIIEVNENLVGTATASDFTASYDNITNANPTSVSIENRNINLTFSEEIERGDTITVSYSGTSITDFVGNPLSAITNRSVQNDVRARKSGGGGGGEIYILSQREQAQDDTYTEPNQIELNLDFTEDVEVKVNSLVIEIFQLQTLIRDLRASDLENSIKETRINNLTGRIYQLQAAITDLREQKEVETQEEVTMDDLLEEIFYIQTMIKDLRASNLADEVKEITINNLVGRILQLQLDIKTIRGY